MTDTLEVIDLESLMVDEPGCQVTHIRIPCTVHVTARLIFCRGTVNMCGNATRHTRLRIEFGFTCGDCDRLASECWRLNPA